MALFRRSYPVKEKLRLIEQAENLTLEEAKRIFGISTSSLSLWRKQKDRLQEVLATGKNKENVSFHLPGAGRPSLTADDTTEELIRYFDKKRLNLDKVDVRMLLTK